MAASASSVASADASGGDVSAAASPDSASGAASAPPASSAPVAGAPEAESGEVAAETSPPEASAEATAEEAEAAKASNPYQQAIDAAQVRINEQARRSGERQADRDTMDEVKRLAARIKAMAQRAKDTPEGDEAERAVAGMDREVQAAMRAMPDVGVALTV